MKFVVLQLAIFVFATVQHPGFELLVIFAPDDQFWVRA